MAGQDATIPASQGGKVDKDLLELLAQLDRPLDRRIIDRGYENLRAFLAERGSTK